MPVTASYRPDPLFSKLGPEFADPVAPSRFPQHILRRRNQAWAARVGLGELTEAEWEAHFGRFEPLPGNMSEPLAMRYHGHQFRNYNPEIGDGRGFLFAQLRDSGGRLLDLATKGSGQTPYSRFGDGRLTLKGGVREVLAAEMLEALGVYTSKAFSLFETGEQLTRGDEPSPTRSSVLVRLSHSHIRFGTFQRLAFFERPDLMHQLIEHAVAAYYPRHINLDAEARAAALFGEIVEANARLAASWMAAGFVHGVLNTDNLNIMGESFDYGPWRFVPTSQPGFTAAYFDESGLYAFGRQPEAVSWALAQLGGALTLACSQSALETELARFGPAYGEALRHAMFERLDLVLGDHNADLAFLQTMLDWMTESQVGWDQFFHDWVGGEASAARAKDSPEAMRYNEAAFAPIRAGLEARTGGGARDYRLRPYFQRPDPVSLVIDEVEKVWAPIAQDDDWTLFDAKLRHIHELRDAVA
ncbi:protein adenylyltransferase SelO [Vitreimonas flagellata]|uniref:protein adenylyltransferase SelO n=1 Tax=Vitreimonas flagellata TaxID=2560861 RepID=UPI001074E684|nr:YdiU family protein [Vitreimonas flagellata]